MKYPSESNHFQVKHPAKKADSRQEKREQNAARKPEVKAREAREAELINQQYYEEIAAEMAKQKEEGKNPTVQDEIAAMGRKGNKLFVKNWKGYEPDALEETFPVNRLTHEVTHLCARIPHSVQGEMTGLAFEGGLNFGVALRQLDEEGIKKFQKGAAEDYEHYSTAGSNKAIAPEALDHDFYVEKEPKHYQYEPVVPASKRDWAIHLAAGMYLREKMDRFVIEGMPGKSYTEQLAFCENYAQKDHVPPHEYLPEETISDRRTVSKQPSKLDFNEHFDMLGEQNEVMFQCSAAPNALIHLSKEEWRAIEGVALGMHEPDQTPYPKRMEAIKEALMHVGMLFDRKTFIESPEMQQSFAEQLVKEQHARIGKQVDASWNTSR